MYNFDAGVVGGMAPGSSGYASLGGQTPQQMSHNLMMMSSMMGVVPQSASHEASPATAAKMKEYGGEYMCRFSSVFSLTLLSFSLSLSLSLSLLVHYPDGILLCSIESIWI